MTGRETAFELARAGVRVHPTRGKAPILSNPLEAATTDLVIIAEWFADDPDAVSGFYPGQNGLLVVDVDVKNGVDGHRSLKEAGYKLPKTWNYATPSGGRHYVYAVPEGIEVSTQNGFLPGIDLRAGNGNVVCYAAEVNLPAATAPDWALAGVAPRNPSTDRRQADPTQSADVATYLGRLIEGKPTKDVKAARKAVKSHGMAHDDMLEAVTELVKLGTHGHKGVAGALDAARATYADGWPGAGRAWDDAVAGSVRHLGYPPVTFPYTKAERRAREARRAAPSTIALSEGAAILDEVAELIGRYVAFPTDDHRQAAAMWIVFTHLIESFDDAPRLWVHSPEPGSGKSRLLEILAKLVRDSVKTVNASAAFLGRRIGENSPTICLDEADTIFGRASVNSETEALRGIINSGYRRGEFYSRAAASGNGKVELESFPTFAPVALAGLGDIPDTIRARAISIPMRRRAPGEIVEPYRERENGAELDALRGRIEAWARTAGKHIGNPWPTDLAELGITDRDADVWEPLISVADAAGGEWPARSREVALALIAESRVRPATRGIRLLADIRRVFRDRDRIPAMDLLGELLALDDSPWSDLGGKGAIDSRFLGRTFAEYDIPAAHTIRFDASTGIAKGWNRVDFVDAWQRYLPETPATLTTI